MTTFLWIASFIPAVFAASGLCAKHAGKLETHTDMQVCVLGLARVDNKTIELQINKKQKQKALEQFLLRPRPNIQVGNDAPAEYCAQLNGTSIPVLHPKNPFDICLFSDGSSIENWTLFKGPKHPDNSSLMKLIQSR